MNIKSELESRSIELRRLIGIIEGALQNAPEGSLRVTKNRNKPAYYHCLGGERTFIRKDQMRLAADLAKKEYYLILNEELKREEKAILAFLKEYHPGRELQLYESMVPGRRALVVPLVMPDRAFASEWREKLENEKEKWPNTYPIGEVLFTEQGENVRSKSEKIIADSLYRVGIPYVYEAPLRLGGRTVFPDFTMLNMPERKTWYWEHFGLLDQEAYLNDSLEKLNLYADEGIFPGDGLLVTYESSRKPMKSKLIKTMIERFLKE